MRALRSRNAFYFAFAIAIASTHIVFAIAQTASNNNDVITNPVNTTLSSTSTLMDDGGFSAVTVNNYGVLDGLTADRSLIYSSGSSSSVNNYGTIQSSQYLIAGTRSLGDYATLTNAISGTIALSGDTSAGLRADGSHSSLINRGTINLSGILASGLHSLGYSNTLDNYGTITLTGDTSSGMTSYNYNNVSGAGDNATLTNYGTISLSGNISAGLVS